MDLYFIKTTEHGSIYKISDFYTGTNYKLNPAYKVNVNLKADQLTNVVLPPALSFNPKDFSHITVPSENIIYKINRYDYENNNQFKLFLEEDALLSNYVEFISKKMYLSRSNNPVNFTGVHDIKDTAIKHTATYNNQPVHAEYTGLWVVYTFLKTSSDIEFQFSNLDAGKLPLVEGTFGTFGSLVTLYPNQLGGNPFELSYYLKFAYVGADLYQFVSNSGGASWVKTQKNVPDFRDLPGSIQRSNSIISNDRTTVLTGDLDTINVAFPMDTTLVKLETYVSNEGNSSDVDQSITVSIPSFYNIESFNHSDALVSVKVIPEEFLVPNGQTFTFDWTEKLSRYDKGTGGFREIILTNEEYRVKYVNVNNHLQIINPSFGNVFENYRLPTGNVKSFRSIFSFDYSAAIGIIQTEPFRRNYLSFWGQLIEIPNKYLVFNVRVAITSSDVLYEVYTDKFNVIASGRLNWFTNYSLDQLDLYAANNPTYRDQFLTNQISGAINNIGISALGGFVAGGPGGAAVGAISSSIVSIGANVMNLNHMEKGLKDKADAILGQNELSMALLRGYGCYMIFIRPEETVLNQMLDTYKYIGFPCGLEFTLNGNLLTGHNVVTGRMIEMVKNNYVTNEINKKLSEGVVIII